MDIRIDHAPPSQQPAEGWHRVPDGRLGYVTAQKDAFVIQFFPKDHFDERRPEAFVEWADRSRRLAWACLAELRIPGPSAPKGAPKMERT